jgi:hypothetical protein
MEIVKADVALKYILRVRTFTTIAKSDDDIHLIFYIVSIQLGVYKIIFQINFSPKAQICKAS